MKDDNVRIFWTTITAEEAKKYLGENYEKNRGLRRTRVKSYAQDLTDGRWNPYAAEPITISNTGKVLNGQHRLAAVVESGVSLYTEMRVGVPEDVYKFFDCGLNRTAADGVSADTKNKSAIMAACRAAISIGATGGDVVTVSHMDSGNNGISKYVTNASLIAFFDKCNEMYPGALTEAAALGTSASVRYTKWTPKSVTLSSLAMIIVDRDMFKDFRDAILDDKNTMVSVLTYKKWANIHDLKNYSSRERTFIEWCAASNVWNELHGHNPRVNAYKKGVSGEMIGFKPKMFDLLGNCKHDEK